MSSRTREWERLFCALAGCLFFCFECCVCETRNSCRSTFPANGRRRRIKKTAIHWGRFEENERSAEPVAEHKTGRSTYNNINTRIMEFIILLRHHRTRAERAECCWVYWKIFHFLYHVMLDVKHFFFSALTHSGTLGVWEEWEPLITYKKKFYHACDVEHKCFYARLVMAGWFVDDSLVRSRTFIYNNFLFLFPMYRMYVWWVKGRTSDSVRRVVRVGRGMSYNFSIQ